MSLFAVSFHEILFVKFIKKNYQIYEVRKSLKRIIPNLWKTYQRAIKSCQCWHISIHDNRRTYEGIFQCDLNFCNMFLHEIWYSHLLDSTVNQCHLPQKCVSLNYMVVTNTIISLSILFRMGKIQDSTCWSCCTASKDMLHLWVTCP